MASHFEVLNEDVSTSNSKKTPDSCRDIIALTESRMTQMHITIVDAQTKADDVSAKIKELCSIMEEL